MPKLNIKLLLVFCASLALFGGGIAEAAQTINGKAIGNVDDVVKELNGELTLAKKGLITIRGGNNNDQTYVDVFAQTFAKDAAPSKARKIFTYPNSSLAIGKPFNPFHPEVSRRLYNGKRAFMFHNISPNNGGLKYYFKTLSNTMSTVAAGKTPDALIDTVQIEDFGEYTPEKFSHHRDETRTSEVHRTGFMALKGYDNEILAVASNAHMDHSENNAVRLEFFAISADNNGKMTQQPLTKLTHKIPYRNLPFFISTAVGDFDGDGYDNELAVMINTNTEIRLFVYRLILSNGEVELRSMCDASGIQVYHSNFFWGGGLEEQPATDMAAGDFDGDGKKEIAILYKRTRRVTDLEPRWQWKLWQESSPGSIVPDGPIVGDVCCTVYQWNAQKGTFDGVEGVKDFFSSSVVSVFRHDPDVFYFGGVNTVLTVTGVVGLRAAAADLNGDGRDEIAAVLLGYHHKKITHHALMHRGEDFCVYPHLTVWNFVDTVATRAIHDDAHVKGGFNGGEYKPKVGVLYDLVKDKNKNLLEDKPFLEFIYRDPRRPLAHYLQHLYVRKGTDPDSLHNDMSFHHRISITAGPFTGTLGTYRTIDDIAIAWRDSDGNDCVTIFKTKLNASKQFDGFEDGKLVLKDKAPANDKDGIGTLRGLVAVDMANEAVELGRPVHLKREGNRSYIAALSAIPYHVDTVDATGTALSEQPVNFTYSDASNGGNMTVQYGKSTTDTMTKNVQQDLSYSIETMFDVDPEAKGGSAFEKVKGVIGFASGIGRFVSAIQLGSLTTEQKRELVWKEDPGTPLDLVQGLMDAFTDRVDKIHQKASTDITTTLIDKDITATTHDAILYTKATRHIWRYPVLTRPLPMWLASGPRIDYTQIENPGTLSGDKQLFVTFTMSENSELRTATSVTDSQYQPLHEEGNFFSYPSSVADVEGYNERGLLTKEVSSWTFSNTIDNSGITFTEATSNMKHTETKVTPGPFTSMIRFFERLFKGDSAKSIIKQPNSDNPKTFTKEYNKTEKIRYSLQGSRSLTNSTADHTVKMQPFVAKEGTMAFATAVELDRDHNARLWNTSSLYQQKPDPSLLLPFKFGSSAAGFSATSEDNIAMQIRGVKFYMPDFAFLTDNRLVTGQNYEIRVPLYNASFKDTDDFIVRLSLASDNTMSAKKITIAETTMRLGGWKNGTNNNKGTAVFNWTANISSDQDSKKKNFYLYVEIDPENKLAEVHEARHAVITTDPDIPGGDDDDDDDDDDGWFGASVSSPKVSDYGGNNTGFYPVYIYNFDDPVISISENLRASAADKFSITSLYFTDSSGRMINDMAKFILDHKDESFLPVTAHFTYSGPETPYALFGCYLLTQSGKQKVPGAGINTIVDIDALGHGDVEDVFTLQDFALFNGNHQVTFAISPSELIDSASEIIPNAHFITFGIETIDFGEEEVISSDEEFYEGEDPYFELEPIPDDIVSIPTTATYSLSANEDVIWLISGVKFNGTASASDDRDLLDIELDVIDTTSVSGDISPFDYGRNACVTVSSLEGYTPKGEYVITVQKSADGDTWTNAGVLKFTAADGEDDSGSIIADVGPAGGGCNTGLACGFLALLLGGFMTLRKKC